MVTPPLNSDIAGPATMQPPFTGPVTRSSFWSRHKTLINFWLDVCLLLLFLLQAWMLTVISIVFPHGEAGWTIWGATQSNWLDLLFTVFCTFAGGIVLHIMLHWTWICGTVLTKLLGRKAGKDDGSQTLVGVGLLIVILHAFAAAVIAARACLVDAANLT